MLVLRLQEVVIAMSPVCTILVGKARRSPQATPAAYLASSPEQFSYIHFVAHGTASRLSPLDSAIVLSKIVLSKTVLSKTAPSEGNAEVDSFKLYAARSFAIRCGLIWSRSRRVIAQANARTRARDWSGSLGPSSEPAPTTWSPPCGRRRTLPPSNSWISFTTS